MQRGRSGHSAALLVPSVAGHPSSRRRSSVAPIFNFALTAGAAGVIVAAERVVRRRVAAVAADIPARIVQLLASLETAGGLEGRRRPSRPHP